MSSGRSGVPVGEKVFVSRGLLVHGGGRRRSGGNKDRLPRQGGGFN
jgi:hypothetical protein